MSHSSQPSYTEADIRRKAYEIWRDRRHDESRTPEDDWREAERLLQADAAAEDENSGANPVADSALAVSLPLSEQALQAASREYASTLHSNLLTKLRDEPLTWIVPVLTLLVTLYTQREADFRQRQRSQDLNHQSIAESFIESTGQVRYSADYNYSNGNETGQNAPSTDSPQPSKVDLLRNRALIAFREMEFDGRRKANIVLFLYQLNILEDYDAELKADHQSTQEADYFFKGGDLKFANFRGYILEDINFNRADLRGVDLSAAQLTGGSACEYQSQLLPHARTMVLAFVRVLAGSHF